MQHSMKFFSSLLLLLFLHFLTFSSPLRAAPLSTSSRWIVDDSGKRVKLACVNWPSHLEPMLAEGLGKQPLDAISNMIANLGFNCVRLTWATFMVTNESLASLTVRQSFQALNLVESIGGIRVNNPDLLDLPLVDAYKAVVSKLGDNNIMVILDNHISKPGWCCSNSDGNGFFGDKYLDPNVWIKGLTKMATMFNESSNVVGMSLRNELRGPKQNVNDWYRYMQQGAEAVHAANPNVLVILSGLSFDTDLSFLSKKQIDVNFTGKLAFEVHWYGFSDGQAWRTGNANQVCGRVAGNVKQKAGFLLDQGWPLFLSEFGVDVRGGNVNDNRYFGCMLGVVAELDLDWALWTLQGSYYLREGVYGLDEVYGVLSWDWCKTRNASMLQRVQALQQPFRGPGVSDLPEYKLIFHPLTGLCILKKSLLEPLILGPCSGTEAWTYTAQNTLSLKDQILCLKAEGNGKPAMLGIICSDSRSKWEFISDSKMHISSNISSTSGRLCLDVGDDGYTIITSPCKCLSKTQECDPQSQWFKLVSSTRSIVSKNPLRELPFLFATWNTM
ncbi:glycosyl hydrolase 5 family protein-like isoform X1 [Typha angustifolia]|uniref:glycosyl hydrolase 5 family protein-like isoform X1 n=2 Tax=Typha angustifolia TaxID=59011 RepID=UPI003C2D3A69